VLGIGQFVLNDGSRLDFPPSLQVGFDFKAAFAKGTIMRLCWRWIATLMPARADSGGFYA
jgi:hypothetical protein